MTTEKIEHYKKKLEGELALVRQELDSVARRNPDRADDWEAQPKDTDTASTEPDEKADKFEEFEGNLSIRNELELRMRDIEEALSRIAGGTFGTCKVCSAPIEDDRLEANPAAHTCKEHLED